MHYCRVSEYEDSDHVSGFEDDDEENDDDDEVEHSADEEISNCSAVPILANASRNVVSSKPGIGALSVLEGVCCDCCIIMFRILLFLLVIFGVLIWPQVLRNTR